MHCIDRKQIEIMAELSQITSVFIFQKANSRISGKRQRLWDWI